LIDHDWGLAPNPFGGYCTIAVCKPNLRRSKNLQLGDWVIGTGAKSLETKTKFPCFEKLIFAMEICEITNMNDYWLDIRFQYKKPNMNGTRSTMFGDNFYYLDENQKWGQIDCAHTNTDGRDNKKHFDRDIRGKNVLIAENFYYFGDTAPSIPTNLKGVCHTTQGFKIVRPQELSVAFITWLKTNYMKGVHGLPINWLRWQSEYNGTN